MLSIPNAVGAIPMVQCNQKLAHHWETDAEISTHAGKDSDLEAFSHNPPDGSFATLVFRPRAVPFIRTCGSSRTEQNFRNIDNQLSVG